MEQLSIRQLTNKKLFISVSGKKSMFCTTRISGNSLRCWKFGEVAIVANANAQHPNLWWKSIIEYFDYPIIPLQGNIVIMRLDNEDLPEDIGIVRRELINWFVVNIVKKSKGSYGFSWTK